MDNKFSGIIMILFMKSNVPMLTSDILQRVYCFKPHASLSYGTCCGYNKADDDIVYFITAKHIIDSGEQVIDVYFKDRWNSLDVKVYHADDESDVAIIKTNLKQKLGNIGIDGRLIISQQVFFLGFPFFGNQIKHRCESINMNFPVPFVKSAYVSGFDKKKIYLDGHNNHGFSGGPVVKIEAGKMIISGVMSAYINHFGEVKFNKNESNNKTYYEENSGIALAFSINQAIQLINKISL